jgi:hypothetical protein
MYSNVSAPRRYFAPIVRKCMRAETGGERHDSAARPLREAPTIEGWRFLSENVRAEVKRSDSPNAVLAPVRALAQRRGFHDRPERESRG